MLHEHSWLQDGATGVEEATLRWICGCVATVVANWHRKMAEVRPGFRRCLQLSEWHASRCGRELDGENAGSTRRIELGGRDGCRKDAGRTFCALLISACVALWPIGVFSPIRTRRDGISGTGAVCVCFRSQSRRVASDGSNTAAVPVTLAHLRSFRARNALLRSRKVFSAHRQRARARPREIILPRHMSSRYRPSGLPRMPVSLPPCCSGSPHG